MKISQSKPLSDSTIYPHAIILTERNIPEPIFVAAIIGIDRLLKIQLDPIADSRSYIQQALRILDERLKQWGSDTLPAFGKPIGIVVNFSDSYAEQFDLDGMLIQTLPAAKTIGSAHVLELGQILLEFQDFILSIGYYCLKSRFPLLTGPIVVRLASLVRTSAQLWRVAILDFRLRS